MWDRDRLIVNARLLAICGGSLGCSTRGFWVAFKHDASSHLSKLFLLMTSHASSQNKGIGFLKWIFLFFYLWQESLIANRNTVSPRGGVYPSIVALTRQRAVMFPSGRAETKPDSFHAAWGICKTRHPGGDHRHKHPDCNAAEVQAVLGVPVYRVLRHCVLPRDVPKRKVSSFRKDVWKRL